LVKAKVQENFNISIAKLKKIFTFKMLIDYLEEEDDYNLGDNGAFLSN